ncbi:helix-turn-helix transcriptional regulator [Plantactinospora sp. GCM10030261]|uniref:helix-turn-helix transcriptional regulator n=1 Tax=Plantactinospora sp. GCM10030261 TaxID=3273420 RepID=UPI00361A3F70
MHRDQLAAFLRDRRAQVRPADVGLPVGSRRRTPGLRREEVAQLAGISVDYYNRLEQARAPRPSRQVLGALGRALRLHPNERAHLFRLAGEPPEPPNRPTGEVPTGIRHLLDLLTDTPAYVIDARYELLAWNPLAAVVLGDPDDWAPDERNLAWRCFLGSPPADFTDPHVVAFAAECVADLRAATIRYPDDPVISELLTTLSDVPEFHRLWRRHQVCVPSVATPQRFVHPAVGAVHLTREVLELPEHGQRLMLHTATPGSRSADALRLLSTLVASPRQMHLPP